MRNLMNDIRDLEIESFTNLSKLLKTFSDNTASHKMSPLEKSSPTNKICGLLHFKYLWEVMLFWEIVLPVIGLIIFFVSKLCRSNRNESMSWMWLYTVIHANLSVWIWLGYFIFTYNYCWQEIASLKCPDCSTVACTGGIFLGIGLVISIIAAIANDQYYPDARMTPREAKNFFAHMKISHPEMTLTLRSHLNSMGDWRNVKKVFFPQSWYDDTLYPNIAQCLGNRKAVVFKITMDVFAKSIEAKDDLRTFVWDFGQEHNQTITLEDVDDYLITAAIHPAQGHNAAQPRSRVPITQRSITRNLGVPRWQPTMTTEKVLRIYVRKDGNLPVLLDILLRFAWVLNCIGLSGIVLHCLNQLISVTERVHIEKRYGPRRQDQSSLDDEFNINSSNNPNNQHTIPMSMPFSSPPPRYVSVFGLSEVNNSPKKRRNRSSHDQNSRIQELCGSNKNKKTKPVINPKINPVQIADEDEILEDEIDSNSGLPTYDEALNNEQIQIDTGDNSGEDEIKTSIV